jgi:hypothetical protein
MKLGAAWERLAESGKDARIRVTLEEPDRAARAAQLLAPLQPLVAGPGVLTFRVVGASDAVKRLLERVDAERIHGTLEIVSSDPIPVRESAAPEPNFRDQWEAALRTIPADWSDLLAEIEIESSDWFDQTALDLVPINPRREGTRLAFRFRAARRFGYGGSPQMVIRCLERCDEQGTRGTVRILRVLSDTRPVQTQGPVWQIDGQTV